ncbi:hypothetical protein N310_11448, partial [Acanthisitta chloris]
SGSLGLDLAASTDVDLFTTQIYKIPTGLFGPLLLNGQQTGGLIIGRSSATISGIIIETGLIDADAQGEINILVHTLYPPVKIPKGQKLAQLIPLPQLTMGLKPQTNRPRQAGSFGSSGGITLLTIDLSKRPRKPCRLFYLQQSIVLHGLLDTGADTSVI